MRPVTSLKKRLWHKCFPVNFAKFFRTLFPENIYILQAIDANNKVRNIQFRFKL